MRYSQGIRRWWNSLSPPSLRSLLLPLVLTLCLSLTACSGASPLSLLTGGGPNVAANTQLGQENTQQVVMDQQVVRPKARTGDNSPVDQRTQTTNNTDTSPLMLILLILGWLAPSPSEIGRSIRSLFTK